MSALTRRQTIIGAAATVAAGSVLPAVAVAHGVSDGYGAESMEVLNLILADWKPTQRGIALWDGMTALASLESAS
jgi:hypothetical protein